MVSDTSEIPENWDVENLEIVEINDVIKKELAETEHTQGIFAHCKQQVVEGRRTIKMEATIINRCCPRSW